MAVFKVNIDTLQETIDVYQTAISDIEQAIKDAEKAIDILKNSGWKSNASAAFFENFDTNWKTSINNRVKIIKHLKECLDDAKNDYGDLHDQALEFKNLF